MRVALVHSFYRSTFPSGENQAVELQAAALAQAGHDVEVFGRHSDSLLGVPMYGAKSALTVATGVGPDPLEALLAFEPDIVHVHNLFPNWGTRWLGKLGVPLVSTIHNFRPICAAGTLLRDGVFCELCPTQGSHHAVRNSCYRDSALKTLPLAIASKRSRIPPIFQNANALIFLSERTRRMYDSYGLGFPEKSHVVPNFTDSSNEDGGKDKATRRDHWVYAGRLSQEKGILELIMSWPQDIALEVVGGGPDEQECRKAATGKAITFYGQQTREFVDGLLKQSKGLVFPSTCLENSPLVYLEALANGLPVVALKGNAVADDVDEGITGVSVDTMAEFAAGIRRVEERLEFYRDNALARFSREFSATRWVTRVEEIYRKVLAD